MTNDQWDEPSQGLWVRVAAAIVLVFLPCSAPLPPWQVYGFQGGSLSLLSSDLASLPPISSFPSPLVPVSPCLLSLPPTWQVTAAVLEDVTGDDTAEWVLLVWRPWRDWPIQRWLPVPSPIAGFHDAAGDSCHLILLDPRDGHEIWAGSALPAPLLALAVGDVDGNGDNEVVTLEGDYAAGRNGPATRVNVWRWDGFGFTLEWHSPPDVFHEIRLTDVNGDGTLDVAAR
jgi:hypothetical protein